MFEGGCEGVCVHDSRSAGGTRTQNLGEEKNQLGNRSSNSSTPGTPESMEPEVLLTLVSSDEDERCRRRRRRRRRFQRARAGIWLPLLARAENTPRQGRLRTLQASEEAAEAAETAVTDINLYTHLLHMLKLAVESAFLETALNSYRIFVLMCATDICRAERGQPKCIRESRAQQPPP